MLNLKIILVVGFVTGFAGIFMFLINLRNKLIELDKSIVKTTEKLNYISDVLENLAKTLPKIEKFIITPKNEQN